MALNFSALKLGRHNLENIEVDRTILKEIVGLSYAGDIRMNVKAESGDKIDKILDGNFNEINKIYTEIAENNGQQVPKFLNFRKLSSINKASSSRMALNQLFLNSPTKNVSLSYSKTVIFRKFIY